MLLRPRWLVAHVVVLAVATAFVNLGLWQLRRLEDKQAYNARLTARMAAPMRDVTHLFPSAPRADDPTVGPATYRRVAVTGTYDLDEEVILRSRSRNSLAGHHVMTPLRTRAGYAVMVDRGWVPFKTYTLPVAEALPPTGEVTVEGVLFPAQVRGRFGPRDEPGDLDELWRADLPRLQEQIEEPLLPLWLHALGQRPPQDKELPKPVQIPRLDEGPHRSYALQWFAFTLTVLIGYGAIIRKRLKERRA